MIKLKCAFDSSYCEGEPKRYRLILDDIVTLCTIHVNTFAKIILHEIKYECQNCPYTTINKANFKFHLKIYSHKNAGD